jgi:hypothetical protein
MARESSWDAVRTMGVQVPGLPRGVEKLLVVPTTPWTSVKHGNPSILLGTWPPKTTFYRQGRTVIMASRNSGGYSPMWYQLPKTTT